MSDGNSEAYERKVDVLREAATKVESILGVHVAPHTYTDFITFYKSAADYHATLNVSVEDREARRLGIGIHFNEQGGTYYPDAAQDVSGDDPWACEPAPWKAAVLEEIRVLLTLDENETDYFDYAAGVFRGDFVHPAVISDIR